MSRRTVMSLGVITGVMAAGYGVMFTVLDDFRDRFGISESRLGMIVGIGFLSSFLAQIFLAPLADRGYAQRIVVIGLLLNFGGLVMLAFGETTFELLVGRFVMGIGLGVAFPAIRRIVILGDPERLGDNLGLLLAADVAGFAVGPLLSALVVGTLGLPAPFLMIAIASLLSIFIIVRIKVEERAEVESTKLAFDLLKIRPYAAAVCMGVAVFIMIGTFDALWVVMLDDLDASEWIANVGITLFVLPMIFLAERGGRLAQRIGPFKVGPAGLILGAVYMLMYGLIPSALVMLGIGILHGFTDSLTVSSSAVAVGMVTPEDRHAGGQGLLGGVQTLSAGTIAVVAGFLYETYGRFAAYAVCSVAMVVLAVAAFVLSGSQRSATPEDVVDVSDPATAVTGHA
jgi:MFS family permease